MHHGMFVPLDEQMGQCGSNITVTPNMASSFSACMYTPATNVPVSHPTDCKDRDENLQACKLRLQLPMGYSRGLSGDYGTYMCPLSQHNQQQQQRQQPQPIQQHQQQQQRPMHQNITKTQTPSVTRRNERERNRVKLINLTFATLRQHIPALTKNGRTKKMSKVDTLKAAIDYIRHLKHLVHTTDLVTNTYNENRSSVVTNSAPHYSPVSSLHSPSPSSCSDSSYEHPISTDDDVLDLAQWF